MAARVAAIHVFVDAAKTWMPATNPATTMKALASRKLAY
jgi:hypothetical protein